MKEVAERQKRFNRNRRAKMAFRNASFLLALLVLIAALLNALGMLPTSANNWITFALSVLTAGVVLMTVWPQKPAAEALADRMKRQAAKSRHQQQKGE